MEAPPEALSSTVLKNICCLGFCWVAKDELLESIFFLKGNFVTGFLVARIFRLRKRSGYSRRGPLPWRSPVSLP